MAAQSVPCSLALACIDLGSLGFRQFCPEKGVLLGVLVICQEPDTPKALQEYCLPYAALGAEHKI